MVERINLILKAKNISARQFAEEIGIQPSNMSHILSGRNNPSLEFVMKVMRRWPEININWLMFGKGEMFADSSRSYMPTVEKHSAPTPKSEDLNPVPVNPPVEQSVVRPPNAEPDLFSQPVVESKTVSHEAAHQSVAYTFDAETEENDRKAVPTPVASSVPSATLETITPPHANPPAPSVPSSDANAVPDRQSPGASPLPATEPQRNENGLKDPPQLVCPVQSNVVQRRAVKVIILYDDRTFCEYQPE
mgnify:CR=1 FL=1